MPRSPSRPSEFAIDPIVCSRQQRHEKPRNPSTRSFDVKKQRATSSVLVKKPELTTHSFERLEREGEHRLTVTVIPATGRQLEHLDKVRS